jgi:hypothetical protein
MADPDVNTDGVRRRIAPAIIAPRADGTPKPRRDD